MENQESILFQNSDLIPEDKIKLNFNEDNKYNFLAYGDSGLVVNVKATSIKKLFDKYGKNGLFSYNLREHISQKNVDDAIDDTIKEEPENFWFYNNGVTFGCEDYKIDGNEIKLYGFSIINGAQTTTKISQNKLVDEKHDFSLVCKIVKSPNSMNDSGDFISKISAASNSQKPIRQRDLHSNDKEQKIMQMKCAKNNHPLAIEIKRGVKPINNNKVEKWQRVTNEYIGQLIYSCLYQTPGPARSNKNIIFTSTSLYKDIFCKEHDEDTIYDLVRLGYMYDMFTDDFVKENNDSDEIAVVQNGKLTILACLVYLAKKAKYLVENRNDSNLKKDNLKGLLVTDYPCDDLEDKVYFLFNFIIRIIKKLYEEKKNIEKITSYSNFFKSEKYYDLILREFDELDDYDIEKINNYIDVFTLKKK